MNVKEKHNKKQKILFIMLINYIFKDTIQCFMCIMLAICINTSILVLKLF